MDILHLNGTFGRLEREELTLSPGLNLLYAPNESGKSTWTALIRTMLYGLSTRERGPLADKNRYAPWNGSPLWGRMELSDGDNVYTAVRETRRAAAPMGEFSCTYTGTATPVPGITGQNLGETLLGVPREVFERSAFIGQNALAVEQDAELERRIAALITTGEEDTSYTEAYERLKKQLNRRRHNKTGLIPALERDIDQLSASLRELDALHSQARQAQEELTALEHRADSLRQQRALWQALSLREHLSAYHQAAQAADDALRRAETAAASAAALPDTAALTLLEGQAAALTDELSLLSEKRRAAEETRLLAQQSSDALHRHPLYPADEAELTRRSSSITPAKSPSLLLPAADALLVLLSIVLAVAFRSQPLPFWIFIGLAVLSTGLTTFCLLLRRRAIRDAHLSTQQHRDTLASQTAEYLPLLHQAEEAEAAAQRAALSAADSEAALRARLRSLLTQVQTFAPSAADLTACRHALADARQQQLSLAKARQQAREAALYRDALGSRLPTPVPPAPAETSEPECPVLSPQQVESELAQVESLLAQSRSRLDTLTGRIRSLDRSSDLEAQLVQKQEQLTALRQEYDAIVLAMDALSRANTTLQNRFSPALGQRAAEIFSAITHGRYDRVLLSRDFSLSAEASGDPVSRSVQLLSQGAADQLYLAVRLAICDMVLPPEKRVPLILDDALVTFDDDRLHAALDYLLEESHRRQILLFTCQKREGNYLRGRENVTVTAI